MALLWDAGVLVAWVFGSQADGTARPDSDVDLAVITDEPLPLLRRSDSFASPSRTSARRWTSSTCSERACRRKRGSSTRGACCSATTKPRRVREVVRILGRWPYVRRSLREVDAAFLSQIAAAAPPVVDPDRVRAKLATFAAYCRRLDELAAQPTEAYLPDAAYEGRYLVQSAAQVCLDLAHHLIASRGWAPTVEYRDAYARLAEHDVLDRELTGRLQDLAGLRNRLVHLYDDVDDVLVHRALQEGRADLDAFAASIARISAEQQPLRT